MDSTPDSKLNHAKIVGDISGNVFVPCFDWQQQHCDLHFRNIPNIKLYHEFVFFFLKFVCFFSHEFEGRVRLHESSEFAEFAMSTDCETVSADLPPTVLPVGLSAQRQLYLYNFIRPFVLTTRKTYCVQSLQNQAHHLPHPQYVLRMISYKQPKQDRAVCDVTFVRASPKCGFCGQTGHRNSVIRGKFTCPERRWWHSEWTIGLLLLKWMNCSSDRVGLMMWNVV